MSGTNVLTRFWWAFIVVGALAVILAVGLPAMLSKGADHLDAPGLTSPGGDGRLDIADVYAFQSPTTGADTVLIMTVNPLTPGGSAGTFNDSASYDLKIDNKGGAKEELTFNITFGPVIGGAQSVTLRRVPRKGAGSILATGLTGTTITFTAPGGGTGILRADTFDDPFFFDLLPLLGVGRSFCDGGQFDFFAGPPAFNVSTIVLELPSASLLSKSGKPNIGVWARTELAGTQIDRMGRPVINTVLIPTGSKDAFNAGEPRRDKKDFRRDVVGTLLALGNSKKTAKTLSKVLLPDTLTVDTSSSAGFLNGRQLADDVIDGALILVVPSGPGSTGDCVPANNAAFLTTFPYLAAAN